MSFRCGKWQNRKQSVVDDDARTEHRFPGQASRARPFDKSSATFRRESTGPKILIRRERERCVRLGRLKKHKCSKRGLHGTGRRSPPGNGGRRGGACIRAGSKGTLRGVRG